MPADHGGQLDGQHHAVEPATVEGTRQQGQDRPISGYEFWPIDLSLENEDLMAKSQDLRVSPVAGHEQQPETSDQEPEQMQDDQWHGRPRYRPPTL